ncbi:MAG: carboxypeptidase-like regulatory domain-containing protein [Lentimicrobiaceae bacterium]|nr:carboxypeptidase-like regulatory domain-containing protein [Lentimicrobiaceae bacterium]
MKNQEENTIDSYMRLINHCLNNETIFKVYKPFVATFDLFNGNVIKINQNREKLLANSTGISADKKNKRSVAAETCLIIAGRLRSMASTANNNTLLLKVKISQSELLLCRENEFKDICNNILNLAIINKTELADYEVSDELINKFQELITDYSKSIPLPREAKSIHKLALQNIRVLIRENNKILSERLDIDIEYFKTSHPDFYKMYKEARNIIDYGMHHCKKNILKLTGTVTDFETEQPIAGVTLKIKETELTAISDVKGKFSIQLTEAGKFTLEANFTGYQPYSLEFEISKDESLEMEVELEKEE